jgi:hypothetical protein
VISTTMIKPPKLLMFPPKREEVAATEAPATCPQLR